MPKRTMIRLAPHSELRAADSTYYIIPLAGRDRRPPFPAFLSIAAVPACCCRGALKQGAARHTDPQWTLSLSRSPFGWPPVLLTQS